ncbi:NUDIX hydrolase [Vaginisenegalia massiliensis]|uniref:NUDIX hydrolase n=1 Tax=Vaginisenegalia massiliensis TaxID=2058294 RepID=UPI000F520214|nr:NUDIX hydrolase [Vaginisenegalia massiliensis]
MKANQPIAFMQDPQLIESQLIFDGKIMQVYQNQLKGPHGQCLTRELVHHQDAVAILALTNNQEVILVQQYRPAVAKDLYEVPAGLMDREDEDPLQTAKRELEEETGYQAARWTNLGKYYVSPGFVDEAIHLFMAQDLQRVDQPLPQDDDEAVEAVLFDRHQIKKMLANHEITDLKTVYALSHWLAKEDD